MSEPILRARASADHDALFRLAADLETWEERNPGLPRPLTREAFDARVAARDDDSTGIEFVVDVAGSAVGRCTLFGIDPLARNAEAGIALLPEARGQGVGARVLEQLVEFGFDRLNLHRIHLEAVASNAGAIRCYEKVGFVVEGRLREHCWVRGAWVDGIVMGLLRAEWSAARP